MTIDSLCNKCNKLLVTEYLFNVVSALLKYIFCVVIWIYVITILYKIQINFVSVYNTPKTYYQFLV